MTMNVTEIIDLGHEMYHDMPNIGGAQVAFWPISSFDKAETISGGKVSMESKMMLLPEHCGTHLDVQQMCNLSRLVGKDFLLVVAPLKIREGTGCPVRPLALVM
jgi:kynurenine formamidase